MPTSRCRASTSRIASSSSCRRSSSGACPARTPRAPLSVARAQKTADLVGAERRAHTPFRVAGRAVAPGHRGRARPKRCRHRCRCRRPTPACVTGRSCSSCWRVPRTSSGSRTRRCSTPDGWRRQAIPRPGLAREKPPGRADRWSGLERCRRSTWPRARSPDLRLRGVERRAADQPGDVDAAGRPVAVVHGIARQAARVGIHPHHGQVAERFEVGRRDEHRVRGSCAARSRCAVDRAPRRSGARSSSRLDRVAESPRCPPTAAPARPIGIMFTT